MNEMNENISIPENKPPKKDKLNLKFLIISLSSFLVVGILISFTALSYKGLVTEFKDYFDKAHYNTANNLILTKGNMNILKSVKLDNDLTSYFKEKIDDVSNKLSAGEISSDDALIIITEINRYMLLDSEIDKAISVLSQNVSTTNNSLTKGISEFEKGNFKEALSIFKEIPSNHEGYTTSLSYISKCTDAYSQSLLKDADSLVSEKYYTKAITLLEEGSKLLNDNKTILAKIEQLKIERDEYIKIRDGKQ